MAEIQSNEGGGGKGKAKKMSTRVDLTPMVDLAFLLITFFMFTTTLAKPKTMDIAMPAKPKEEDPAPKEFPASKALTILLGSDNVAFSYEGKPEDAAADPAAVKASNFDPMGGIRKVILDKKNRVDAQHGLKAGDTQLLVLIKPGDESTYKNIVDVLDEMHICKVKTYAIVDISEPEKEMMKIAMANAK